LLIALVVLGVVLLIVGVVWTLRVRRSDSAARGSRIIVPVVMGAFGLGFAVSTGVTWLLLA
jgi:hypothetical protein